MMGWRELFSQWNTKTLGGSSKLGVSNYELITDGVHVELDNLEALEMKNTVGQAANLQSQSGPIEGTVQIKTVSLAAGVWSYLDFGAGIWAISDVIVTYEGGSGTQYVHASYYDGTYNLEWLVASTTSTTSLGFNYDSQFDEVAGKRWGGNMQLGLYQNGTFDVGTSVAHVVCYRVR